MINVFHIVSNKIWGGPEQYSFDVIRHMLHDDYYVEVVCRHNDAIVKRFRSLEIPVSTLPLKGPTDIDSSIRLARLLKKGKNVIHVHSFSDAFAAILAKHLSENPETHVVMTLHHVKKPYNNYLFRKFYDEIDRFIFPSQLTYDLFTSTAKKFDTRKACIIRESVPAPSADGDATAVPDLRKKLGVAPGQSLIMFHGRLCHEKGIDVALRALTQLDKNTFKMAVIGSGNHKFEAQLKGFIVANQLVRNVSFLGFNDNVLPLSAQCDFGVLPSVVPEAMGLANLEYMIQGKAHITTDNGAQKEYVTNGSNGLLVTPGNYFETAQAIKTLIDDKSLCQRLGSQAQADFRQNLSYTHFYSSLNALYHSFFS